MTSGEVMLRSKIACYAAPAVQLNLCYVVETVEQ